MSTTELDILNIPISEPRRIMTEYSWTVYGVGGFGKSGLASRFPESLFYAFEAGQNALRARKLPISDWKEFKKHNANLVKAKKAGTTIPYRNFIIDTSDVAWKYCVQYVCKMNGWSHPSDAEWGKGWQACADEWFFEMDQLIKLGTEGSPCTVINILHDTEKEFKPKGKEKFNKTILNIPAGGRAVVYDKVDFVIHCSIETGKDSNGNYTEKRVMRFRDNGEVEAKSRLAYFPDTLEYGANADEAFENLLNAFNKAIIDEFGEADAPPPKKAVKAAKQKEEKKADDTSVTDTTKAKQEAEVKALKEKEEAKAKKAEADKLKKEAEVKAAKEDAEEAAEAQRMNTEEAKHQEIAALIAEMEGKSLDELRKEVEVKFMALYKSGAKTPQELMELVKEHTGKNRVTEIDDPEKAKNLLLVLND
ncbi:ATP-binding protein [Paenibacillus chitinolyticus]|uniref:ATP-binding protein n=1 Tax=Paenibacillus chitinolyticus TaxID=79263 RepID=UPI003CFC64DA